MLAVAILVESRFPDNAFVTGDFDKALVEKLIPWINAVLEKPVMMPICHDGKRLFARLNRLYDDKMLLCDEFEALFGGLHDDALKELLLHADKSIVMKKCARDLLSYKSLSQGRATNVLKSVLETTADLREVITSPSSRKSAMPCKYLYPSRPDWLTSMSFFTRRC